MPDVEQHGYRAYPLVDHVADKVCAILERHGPTQAPSTRFRDLVDLVAIVVAASVDAQPQMAALRSEAERRGLQLPARWWPGDQRLVGQVLGVPEGG
jgi:nucleotidyltransferase AbiEii toxin of type IV toxin-antitoxin system